MSENVSENAVENDQAMVEMIFNDPQFYKMDLGSDEFKAALAEKTSKMNEEAEAPAGTDETEEDKAEAEDDLDKSEDDESGEDDETEDEPKAKKSRGMVRRIEKLVEEKHDLKRRLEQLEAASKSSQVETPSQPQSLYDQPKPMFKDYDSLEDYTDALTEWKLDKREYDREQLSAQQSLQKQAEKVVEVWGTREEAFKSSHKDYSTFVNVESVSAVDPSLEAKVFLADSEHGPLVLYTLLKDEGNAMKFAKASPVGQVAMLARLEERLSGSTSGTSINKTIASKAPTPPKTLPNGKSTATATDLMANSGDMSFQEWSDKYDEYERSKKRK